ncbi:MAG: bifunctional diguanylate cyclase/phosphodiesterase [Alcaligenaceae bacterium]|nr:bifunctional diguanylate cyclase/phosphodiesterase [Alcaligenaceae bacterium]
MTRKALSLVSIRRWRFAAISHQLASVYFPGLIAALTLLCVLFLEPDHLAQAQAFQSMATLHHYLMLEGALIGFISFCTLIAFYKKNRFFLMTAAWMACNLWLGSYFIGSQNFWFQHELPANLVPYLHQVAVGMYFVISLQLLHFSLGYPYSQQRLHSFLTPFCLTVFVLSLIPYPSFFHNLLSFSIPIGLLLGLTITLQHLNQEKNTLQIWQIVLLSLFCSGLLSYAIHLVTPSARLLDYFDAFIFLVLANSMVAFGIAHYLKHLLTSYFELRSNYQNSPFSVIKIDRNGNILQVNCAFKRLCSKHQQSIPATWEGLFHKQAWMHIVQRTQSGKYTELQFLPSVRLLSQNPLFALYAHQAPDGYVITLQDITPYINTLNRFKALADNDPVTHILNQRGLEKALQYTMQNLSHHQPCFLAYLDLNQVNHVNRTYGHEAGDALLQEVSQRILELLPERHTFGRMGSDDFVFLLANMSLDKAKKIASIITDSLNQNVIKTSYRDYQLHVHLGLIELGEGMDEKAALRTAQSACMAARRQNKGFILYEHNSQEMKNSTEELELFENLENGGSRGLFLQMQPLLNLKDPLGSFNLEVLLRVQRTNGELIPLHTFIPIAEENGTIQIIDKWVFNTALQWLHEHQDQLTSVQLININLSGSSLNNDKFIDDLFKILEKYEHLLHRLCVEITEGVALQDLTRTRDFMVSLQQKGVRIALDDFGAGYTSFSYLRELPAHGIKIDGSLIKDMQYSESNIAIVRTIVELARNLGMKCVAEWVEDVETLALLKEMGVDYVQGYVVSAACCPKDILQAQNISGLIKQPDVLQFIRNHYHQ